MTQREPSLLFDPIDSHNIRLQQNLMLRWVLLCNYCICFIPAKDDPDLCRNTMKYGNTHKCRDAVEIRLHFINKK
jgi:hypothetical protein